MADEQTNNYVVGRGRLFFGQFKKGTRRAMGQHYFGNTPELSMSQDEDTLDHYSSEGGVRVKDASATLQNDQTGSFACDNISMKNLALWFRGEVVRRIEAGSGSATGTITFSNAVPEDGDTIEIGGQEVAFREVAGPNDVAIAGTIAAQATALANYLNDTPSLGVTATAAGPVVTLRSASPGAAGNGMTLARTAATPANLTVSGASLAGGTDVTENVTFYRGRWHQLGVTAETPQGVRNVGGVTIAGVEEDAYLVEEATGRIYINEDAPLVDEAAYEVSYGVAAAVEDIVIARGETIEGELLFLANNAAGENKDYFWPYVKLTPDGDLPLKGDDWQTMTFSIEVLKRDAVTERQYITARR